MSVKSYKCPFCTHRGTKEELGSHVEEEHEECIPKGMTANQIVFNSIYHKDHGTCVVCKRPTKWNEVACKYNRLCGRASCQKTLREAYKKNMLKVHGTTTLLNDPEQQEKMLANRKISGKYKFTDGGFHIYTGSYEEKALEFLDKVMEFKSTDILSPGPIIEYTYKGKKLVWITDIMLIPFNLIIEVKDGGSNPNNREMPVYREKQLAKEEMITNMGKYNYLRLTNNDFSQLLGIVAELKAQMIDDNEDNKKVIINVNEEVRMLKESVLQESSVGYDDAKKIYDSLTDEEKGFVSPNGRFVDSPILVYRYIYKVGKKAVGFIDCYKNNGKSITTAFIVYAVSAKYRGKGISKVLLDKAVAGCRSKGYKKLIYRCNSKNTASIKAAESYGFKLIKSSKNEKLYKIDLDDSINEGTNSSTSPIYYNYRDNNLILESTKSVKGPKELVDLYNRLEENFSYEERDDNYKGYRTKSPEEFEKLGYGVCWDYADYEAKELEKVGYRCTTKDLTNNTYSLYYHQFNSDDGMNPTHTWVACMKDNKVYVVESSWYSFKGVHCFDNEEDMIAVYVNKLNEDRLPNLLMKYKPSTKFGLDAVKYMNHIYNTGVIVIDNVGMQESVLQEKSLPLFFSEEDKCYNVDKWIDGKIDTLFICGMSGGGKSTTANIFADKYNGTVVSLDAIYIYMLQMPSLRKKLLQYKNELKYIALFSKEEYGSETGILYSDDDKDEKGVKFIKFCSRYIKRPIFEGVQVARIYFKDNSIFKDAAILIKGTSTFTSLLRRVKRDKSGLSDIVYYMKSYYKHYKQQSKFMNSLDNDMLQEGTPIIFSEKDLVLNLDAWKNKELSILYIVGLSGSGKSTLSEELSDEYDAHHIDTDKILWWLTGADSMPTDKIPWRMEDWYGNTKVNTNIAKKVKSDKTFRKKLMEDYIKFIISSNERFVIEGAFILDMYEYHSPLLNDAAFIIKGTSLTTSIIRRIKRDYGTPSLAMKRIPKIVNGYKNYISITNRMRDDMFEENLITESAFDKYKKKYKNFDEFCKDINTPMELLEWMYVNKVEWEDKNSRGPMHWPDDIVKNHSAICFDQAVFEHYFCEKNGIENVMLHLRMALMNTDGLTNKKLIMGHVITLFKDSFGGWSAFVYTSPKYSKNMKPSILGSYTTMNDLIKYIVTRYSLGIERFYKVNIEHGSANRLNTVPCSDISYRILDSKYMKKLDTYYGNTSIGRDEMNKNIYEQLGMEPIRQDFTLYDFAIAQVKYNGKKLLDSISSSLFGESSIITESSMHYNYRDDNIVLESTKSTIDPMLESVRRGKPNLIPVRSDNKSSLLGLDTHALNIVVSTIVPGVYITAIARSLAPLLILAGAAALAGGAQWFHMDFLKVDKYGDSKKNGKYIIDGDSVYATNDGEVSFICRSSDKVNVLGNAVVIKHDRFYSLYAHMQDNSITVKKGDIVSRGDIIGKVGNTGNSTESHLHFGFAYTDPSALRYLAGLGSICKEIDNLEQYDYIPISDSNIMDASLELDSGTIKLGDFTDKKYIKNKTGLMHPFCFIKTNNRVVETAMIENFIRPIDTNKEE